MKVLICFGTRPEAIKMAPVIESFAENSICDVFTLNTGQHLELMQPVLDLFDIKPNKSLSVMENNDTLANLFSRILMRSSEYMSKLQPDVVLVHGDTSTTLAVSLAAFYLKIPILHVEAGLRSFDYENPFPEEMNRVLVGKLASCHFAPTEIAKKNLSVEKVQADKIFVTGNTVVDALHSIKPKINQMMLTQSLIDIANFSKDKNKNLVFVTCHRRENHGYGLGQLCDALLDLSKTNLFEFVFVLHMNPEARGLVLNRLTDVPGINLVEPLNYVETLYMLDKSKFILTDSGGLQEEAPAFGTPVLVLRDTTERPEGIEAGVAKLIGVNKTEIINCCMNLVESEIDYLKMARSINPYGDGKASKRIVDATMALYYKNHA